MSADRDRLLPGPQDQDVAAVLRGAAGEVWTAVATLPRPVPPGAGAATPPGRVRPVLALVAVATVVAVVAVGLTGWLGGSDRAAPATQDPSSSPTPAVTVLPPTDGTTLTPDAVRLDETAAPAAPLCGRTLATPIYPPKGWTGPQPGPADGSTAPVLPGQLVVHWSGDGGAFEVRWPADPEDTTPYDPMESAGATEDEAGNVLMTAPVPGTEPPCSHLSVAWFGDVPAGYGKGVSLGGPATHNAVFATLISPADQRLVTRTRQVAAAPKHAVPCDGGSVANRRGRGGSGVPPQPTDEQALQAFLDAQGPESGMNASGWTRFREADGGTAFGVPFDGGGDRWVQLVVVEDSGNGWVVTRWETSGC